MTGIGDGSTIGRMANDETAEPVTAMRTLERLSKLTEARITATSPQGRARVTLRGGQHNVELRPEGFQRLDPKLLAEEVTHAFNGTLRGHRQQEQRILGEYRQARPHEPQPRGEAERERVRRACDAVSVKATSSGRLVRGTWSVTDGVNLKIAAVNDSHREQLATEIAEVLNELSHRFRTDMREAVREARRQAPQP